MCSSTKKAEELKAKSSHGCVRSFRSPCSNRSRSSPPPSLPLAPPANQARAAGSNTPDHPLAPHPTNPSRPFSRGIGFIAPPPISLTPSLPSPRQERRLDKKKPKKKGTQSTTPISAHLLIEAPDFNPEESLEKSEERRSFALRIPESPLGCRSGATSKP